MISPVDYTYKLPNPFGGSNSTYTLRGYTFHEHLEMGGLINMNAHLYDPLLGRVLSPDNYVQAPDNTQSFNRYSYCWNNPTKYTDPSGDIIFTAAVLIAAPFTGGASLALLPYAIGADIGGTINVISNANNIDNFGEFAASYGAGAFAGAATVVNPVVGAGIGGAVLSGTNNIVAQSDGNFKNINWGQVGLHAIIGGLTGLAGGATAKYIGDPVGKMVSSKISNQAIRTITHRAVQFGITGAVGGATNATATAGFITGDYSNVWESTWKGFAWGAAGGAVWGGIEAAGNHANKMNASKGINDKIPNETINKGSEPFNEWIQSDPTKSGMTEYLLDDVTITAKSRNPFAHVRYNLTTPWYQPVTASYAYYTPLLCKKITLLKLR
jgi:RHS repeat-associated protein